MKRTLLLSLFFFGFYLGKAQWVSIPDINFGVWLNMNGYSACLQGNSQVGWQMDTTCAAVVNAVEINCTNRNIINLNGIQYFDNLNRLLCADNDIDTLSALPPGLTSLFCERNYLKKITSLPPYLDSLWCGINRLDSLPPLPASLRYLNCSVNYYLRSLPLLPTGLKVLECASNLITALPPLPDSLLVLDCYSNRISVLPALPNSLIDLNCAFNLLSTLPVLPPNIYHIFCSHNQIASIPNLPDSLTSLECTSNQLSVLPALPGKLKTILCSHNQLISLPALPPNLNVINCENNQITSIPALPASLTWLLCTNNQISYVPALPDSMVYCYLDDNPPLTCLPWLTKIYSLRFSNTLITCVPNYGNIDYSLPELNTVPVCDSASNTHGCQALTVAEIAGVSFSVFPNPATTTVTISIDESMVGSTATITDITGREIMRSALQIRNPQFDIRNLADGIYFVTITNGKRNATKKLIIHK